MIDFRQNEIHIVEGLKEYLSKGARPCEVVRQNQIVEVPPYPYVSYTLTTPASLHGGTYSVAEDGTQYKDAQQTWSYTAQSDDPDEAMAVAMRIMDYFSSVGLTYLADHGITVRRVRDITTRDNMLSIQYEHRNGLDVTFGLLSVIEPGEQVTDDVIESIKYGG